MRSPSGCRWVALEKAGSGSDWGLAALGSLHGGAAAILGCEGMRGQRLGGGSAGGKPLRERDGGEGEGAAFRRFPPRGREAAAELRAPSPARHGGAGGGQGGGSGGAGRGGAEAGRGLREAGAAAAGSVLSAPGRFGDAAAGTWAPSPVCLKRERAERRCLGGWGGGSLINEEQ